MTTRVGFIGTTIKQAVGSSSANFQVDASVCVGDKRFSFIVVADVPTHLHRTEGGGEATDATTSDMLIPANTPYLVSAFAGDWFSYIREGSSSGNIYFTATDGR